jgi:hypothetical protein
MKRKRDESEIAEPAKRARAAVAFVTKKWSKCSAQLIDWFEREERQQEDEDSIIPRSMFNAAETGAGALFDINRRVTILRKTYYLNFNGNFTPSPQQRALFDLVVTINMRWVVGSRYEMYKPLLLTELQLVEIKRDLHYVMSRQQGKTTAIAETSATFAIHIAMKMSIFSTGGRASEALMEQTQKAVRRKLGDEAQVRMVRHNTKIMWTEVIPLEATQTVGYSDIRAYPASGASKSFVKMRVWLQEQGGGGGESINIC